MSTVYGIFPLDDNLRGWLAEERVVAPSVDGRWSTMRELRTVLARYDVQYRDNGDGGWDADVRDPIRGWRATIWTKPAPSDDEPFEHTYHKPMPELMMAILVELAQACGPFVVVDASSMVPVVVEATGDPETLANAL